MWTYANCKRCNSTSNKRNRFQRQWNWHSGILVHSELDGLFDFFYGNEVFFRLHDGEVWMSSDECVLHIGKTEYFQVFFFIFQCWIEYSLQLLPFVGNARSLKASLVDVHHHFYTDSGQTMDIANVYWISTAESLGFIEKAIRISSIFCYLV